ncbi:MAG: hypothetical protein M1829_002871 [Trizodia sp. TS-e1964]|nr:MAG: hypothetical protein M1829_002871 [Trizodia sp. TS-e1964]
MHLTLSHLLAALLLPLVHGQLAPPVAPGVGAAGGPVQVTLQPMQVPSVTVLYIQVTRADGQLVNVQTTFTQTFSQVPDQLPLPSSGSIGLGTITGEVGAVKTAMAGKSEAGGLLTISWRLGAVGVIGGLVGGFVLGV